MLKKALIIAALLTIGATGLMAQTNWAGAFDGDKAGTWQGSLTPYQDPCFLGTWEEYAPFDPPPHGFIRGETIELIKNFYYVTGYILDDKNNVIGKWEGKFPAFDDALASGTWCLESGESGKWTGWSI
ncbi:hypothetical protein GX441_12235 [bacterium]|nr:hypothetical protein [bacterium]